MLSFFFSFFFPFYITYCLISSILSLLFLRPHFLLLSLTHISISLTHTPDLIISSTIKGEKKKQRKRKRNKQRKKDHINISYTSDPKEGFSFFHVSITKIPLISQSHQSNQIKQKHPQS